MIASTCEGQKSFLVQIQLFHSSFSMSFERACHLAHRFLLCWSLCWSLCTALWWSLANKLTPTLFPRWWVHRVLGVIFCSPIENQEHSWRCCSGWFLACAYLCMSRKSSTVLPISRGSNIGCPVLYSLMYVNFNWCQSIMIMIILILLLTLI